MECYLLKNINLQCLFPSTCLCVSNDSEKAIWIDTDVIVQGDIFELWDSSLRTGKGKCLHVMSFYELLTLDRFSSC